MIYGLTNPMLKHTILSDDGIVMVEPSSALTTDDFKSLAESVDHYLESHDHLVGLMVLAPKFPGWDDFAGLVSHIRFVKEHHTQIRRVALVSDSAVAGIAPKFAEHFVSAEVRHFPADQNDAALEWLKE